MSNNYAKQLSTEQITQKLTNLNYAFDDQCWNDFQQQYQSGRASAVSMPTKINPKLLAIPVGLILIASIVYFSITNMRSEGAIKSNPVGDVKPAVEVPIVAPPKLTPKPTVAAIPVKKDTVIVEPKKAEEPKKVVVEEVAKVKSKKDKDSSEIKQEDTARVKNNTANNDEPRKSKKKKKKRRNSGNTNSLSAPSADEDNVVIPEN